MLRALTTYIAKPIDVDELLRTLERVVRPAPDDGAPPAA